MLCVYIHVHMYLLAAVSLRSTCLLSASALKCPDLLSCCSPACMAWTRLVDRVPSCPRINLLFWHAELHCYIVFQTYIFLVNLEKRGGGEGCPSSVPCFRPRLTPLLWGNLVILQCEPYPSSLETAFENISPSLLL